MAHPAAHRPIPAHEKINEHFKGIRKETQRPSLLNIAAAITAIHALPAGDDHKKFLKTNRHGFRAVVLKVQQPEHVPPTGQNQNRVEVPFSFLRRACQYLEDYATCFPLAEINDWPL